MLRVVSRRLRRDTLNCGSSMTLGSKGMRLSPEPHRHRMPWTAAHSYVPGRVLQARDKCLLDGTSLLSADEISRAAQLDPLQVLQSAVAEAKYQRSTGQTLFQLLASGRAAGQRVWRREWMEGTHEKYITLTSIIPDRDGKGGEAYGYVTFHGESTTRPVKIEHANIPGWVMDGTDQNEWVESKNISPPASIGTDTPVNPKAYRLKAYPYYDPPNPPEFVEQLLKDRGVIPDVPVHVSREMQEDTGDGSVPFVK